MYRVISFTMFARRDRKVGSKPSQQEPRKGTAAPRRKSFDVNRRSFDAISLFPFRFFFSFQERRWFSRHAPCALASTSRQRARRPRAREREGRERESEERERARRTDSRSASTDLVRWKKNCVGQRANNEVREREKRKNPTSTINTPLTPFYTARGRF